MKYLIFFLLIGISLFSAVLPVYASVDTTRFDLEVTSENFYEPNLNRFYLIMKPGDSQQVTIQVTNIDSKSHKIDLHMEKETPRPERSFVFEPAQLEIQPGKTKTSILTVSASPDASTGTTIWHTLIAKSATFGAKAFGFYVQVDTEIIPPHPDMVRRGGPGSMFSSQTNFDISEENAIKQIPYNISTPEIPAEYLFQGTYGSERKQLIYSKHPISHNTGELEFWDNGGLLISFSEKKDFTFDEHLGFLGSNEQQVRINGKNGIASESIPLSTHDGEKIYSNSRVTVFLDDVQLRITSQMPLEQILRISESMVQENTPEEFTAEDITCGRGTKLVDGVCIVPKHEAEPIVHGDCLIATASYGTPMAKEVQMLREIRDLQLLQTESGSAFMNSFNTLYYSFAPTVAQWEYDNPVFKEIVKTVITPLIASLSLLQFVEMDSESAVLGYGSGMIMLNIGMYFVAPAVTVWQIKKRIHMI